MADQILPDTTSTQLYAFESFEKPNTQRFGAPLLVPKSKTGVINVTNDFPWTTLPLATRKTVPSLEMHEYRVTSSTLVQSFIQQARSAVDAVGGAGENIVKNVKKGLTILGAQISDDEFNKWLSNTINVSDAAWLDPYKHLYPVSPTGWHYTFPFLSNQNSKTANEWSTDNKSDLGTGVKQIMTDSVAGGGIGNVINALEVGAKTSKIFNLLEPGSYTETIKHYAPTEGETYKVQFTLLNTLKFEDIQKNWELCFVLTYQNRSNRRSVSLLDPPVIYNVTIPGVTQLLYAFIQNLEIANMGTSRYVDLPIGKKLIPEAYQVSFDIKSLLTPTQNLLLYAHTGSKVEVDVK